MLIERVKEWLKRKRAAQPTEKARERNLELDIKDYTPREILEKLFDECQLSGVDVKTKTEEVVQSTGEMVSPEAFRDILYTKFRFNGLSKGFIDLLFRKLDPKKSDKVSIRILPVLIYSPDNRECEKLLMLPEAPLELLKLLSEAAHGQYTSAYQFASSCRHRHESEINHDEFIAFVRSLTRFKDKEALAIFNYLDEEQRGTLSEGHVIKIWDYVEKLAKEQERFSKNEKSRDFEKINSFEFLGMGAIGMGGEGKSMIGMGKNTSSFNDSGAIDRFDEGGPDELNENFSQGGGPQQPRRHLDEMEELAMKMSLYATETVRMHGRNQKEIFFMFAEKESKRMKLPDFREAAAFLTTKGVVEMLDESAVKGLFNAFTVSGRYLTQHGFMTILYLGKKVNSIYSKLKKKYGEKFKEAKTYFHDELNKLSVRRGDGHVPLLDLKKLFQAHKVEITEVVDCEVLKEEGILTQKEKVNVVNVIQFVNKVFQEESEFLSAIKKRAAERIRRGYLRIAKIKQDKKNENQVIKNIFGGLGDSINLTKSRISPTKQKPKSTKKIKPTKTTEEKMLSLMPDHKTSPNYGLVHNQKITAIAENILLAILDAAVHQGESNILKKNVQRRFANRPVNKDNIVTIQEETFAVSDIMPRSVSTVSSIGRLFYMNKDANLSQYDLANNQMLISVDLNSRIPMKKDEVMDYLLDQESGLLYLLKVSWILECWNIFHKSRSPAAKVKIVDVTDGNALLTQSYKTRYLGAFPGLLSLSQNSRQYLVVNCTMANGKIFFLDPISLSILNQTKIRYEDLNISPQLNRIFFQLKPLFTSLAQQHISFNKIFESEQKAQSPEISVPVEKLRKYFFEGIPSPPISTTDFDELINFMDLDGSGSIEEAEWLFLAENVRLTSQKTAVHASYEIPEELKDIDKNVARIFYDIYDFIQKKGISMEDMFQIFDSNNSGKISEAEFIEIISEIAKDTTLDMKRKFFKFIDKDGNRQVDTNEFIGVFKLFGKYSPSELLPSEAPRSDFFVIIEKAFDHGIDIEQEFIKLDEFNDGGIEPHRFRFLVKSLPFGVTETDVENYIENSLQFTSNGCINYLEIFASERYKRIKVIYQIKRGIKDMELKMKNSEDAEKFVGQQKIIVESVIHLSSEDSFIYTVVSPKTSTIFVAKTKKSGSKQISERFEAHLLARLVGHESREPPTILYVNESGCLLSGEKLPPLKDDMTDFAAKANAPKSNESFGRFYSNITANKTRVASIFVWNLARDLFSESKVNPPWRIPPSRVIEHAHYNSITCLSYMPLCQLIVSTSLDGSIKFWDPTARPHSLVHQDAHQKVNGGYLKNSTNEITKSNLPFSEVKRFYTGELTCYAMVCQHQRVPVPEKDGLPKFRPLEYLIVLELGKAQRSGGRLKTEGLIKILGVERVTMEIPVSRYEEPLPKQLWAEIEDLAISNRQTSKLLFKRNLSTSLDKILSRVVIQKTELGKVAHLLKNITLDRFNGVLSDAKVLELFELLVHLPIRNPDSHPRLLSVDEVHMNLKKNSYLFPSKMSKEAFVGVAIELIQKSSHYLIDYRNKNQNKFLNTLSQKISKKEIDTDTFFTKEEYTRAELKKVLQEFSESDDEIEDLITDLDPFFSNNIKLDTLKVFFSTEIINAKINEFSRPTAIISQINAKLSRSNKVDLLRNLFSADGQGIGKVSMFGFLQAFSKLSRSIDENLLKELFILMSEEEEGIDPLLDLSYFCKKLLTHSEQFELSRVYNALAKIKNSLRFRLKSLEDLFVDEETDFKGKSTQNMTVSVHQFMRKVKDLEIVGLGNRELNLITNFLSTVDQDGNTCISLLNMSAYLKKIEIKYQFTNLADYKMLVKELKRICKIKDEFCRKWTGMCNRELIGYGEMRILLNHFNVQEETIDLILLKFMEQETSSSSFFNKVDAFISMNSFLEDSNNLKVQNAKVIANKLFQDQEKARQSGVEEEEKQKDPVDLLIGVLEKYETKKTLMTAFNVCKKFDRDNTGRINVADFSNIMFYNLEFSKHPESESTLLAFQEDFLVKNNLKTIEYGEIFDKLEVRRAARLTKTATDVPETENNVIEEASLTEIISKFGERLRHSNFNLEKAFELFDRDMVGLVVQENFRKVVRWAKVELNEDEQLLLEDNLSIENAINYRKFLELIEIDQKHINVQFDADLWFAISKNFSIDLFEKLNLNLEYLRYFHSLKKDPNPLVNAAVLGQSLQEFKDFSPAEIEDIIKYGVVGSVNHLTKALQKLERTDMRWEYEYIHMPFFLNSVPLVLDRKRDLSDNKNSNRIAAYQKVNDDSDKSLIISKVKGMLLDRGVTMWESIISSSSESIEGSKISKNNFLRMLRMIDLDLTVKEKVLMLKVLDPKDTGKIELTNILEKFESGSVKDQSLKQDSLLIERFIYPIYYGGHDLDSAFEVMDEDRLGKVTGTQMTQGINKLDIKLSKFEIDLLKKLLGLSEPHDYLNKGEFRRKIKKLMKEYKISPTKQFSYSLFSKIKNLIEKEKKVLIESFKELDIHKSGYADLDLLKEALKKFGLVNIKIHEIKTLVKVFTKDVNANEDDADSEPEVEEVKNKSNSMDLFGEIADMKPVEKKNDPFDVNNPNFRIDYTEFVARIQEELESSSKKDFQGADSVIRKVYNMTRLKELTIYEAYVYFDVNNQNLISNVQIKIGLQNLGIHLDNKEMQIIWDILDKNRDGKVSYASFLTAFFNAGCIEIIRFDDKVGKLVKKFCLLLTKQGNLEEIFKKLDADNTGTVKLDGFKLQCEKLHLEFKEEELTDIFRVFCNPEELNPQLKKKKKSLERSQNDSANQEETQLNTFRAFSFKNFVSVISFFRKKEHLLKLLHKFDSIINERGLSYQKIFEDYWSQHKEKKKGGSLAKPAPLSKKKGTKQEVKTLSMTEFKALLKNLKLSFNSDEVNMLCDAFETETISADQMGTIIRAAVENVEKDKNDKQAMFLRITKEIENAIQLKNSSLQKIFFDFDSRSDGSLRLDELNEMLNFLQVNINKTEVKKLFEEMDYDKKGTVTIKEFQSFFDQTYFSSKKKEENVEAGIKSNSSLEPIIKKMQEAAINKSTSLEKVIQSQNIDLNQILALKVLEKVLMKMDCVLKRDELNLVLQAASRDQACSWADLIDWGIKNNIDFRTKEKVFSQFPPAVQVVLSKVMQSLKKMDVPLETAFKYFTKDGSDLSMRNDFLTLIQGFQVQTNEEELIGLYNFFDERNYGEISKSTFVEKCDIARDFYKWSDNLTDVNEKKGMVTLTLRQHVMTILEKMYLSFLERNYNRKQIFAVFDKHGNGMISRDDFLNICVNLGVVIQLEYKTSLLSFIDPTESQIISITNLINKMEESVPDNAKDSLKYSQAQGILRDITGKLKVHCKKFLSEFLNLEKKLQVNDLLNRNKTGISMYDFYRLLSNYGIRLQESEKMIMNAAFKNKRMADYFVSESLYMSLDKFSNESGMMSDIETENMETWENNILRRVADKLRSMNLSLDKAFSNIHTNNLGFIKIVDFKQLLFSLDINLSQKDVDLLISRLANVSNPNVISFEEFKQRFWACFFEDKNFINPLNIENRTRQIASMLLNKIRYEIKMPLSYAWDRLDREKTGLVNIEGLKAFLLEIKLPITKEDLGSLFSLIDQGQDSQIDQYEFVEFWNMSIAADFERKSKKLKKFEADVLGQIVKKLSQKGEDLVNLFKNVETSKNEYLDERQLNSVFNQLGLNFNDGTVREIMKLINTHNPERVSFNQLETALLRNGLKPKDKKEEVKVDFNNVVLTEFLNALNVTANKNKIKVNLMVRDFDEDYDGFLTIFEFCNLIRSLENSFKTDEIQKLAHHFASPTSPNKIVIENIIQAQAKQEKIESLLFENLCDADSFKAILENFDPTLILFKRWSKLKQSKIRFEKYLDSNRDKLRGFQLLSVQYKLKQMNQKIDTIHSNIKLLLQNLKNSSTQMICDEALVKWIDPALCSIVINKKEQQIISAQQDSININEYSSSQQFSIKYDTVQVYNKFFNIYKGQIVQEGNADSKVRIYPAETLRRVSRDGKFMEEHLILTLKIQTMLNLQHPDMFGKIHGYYSRKVGMDPKDRDIYVFYEVLGSDWVCMRDFVNSTGGLVRTPFLVTSNSIFHVIKYWFQKILSIVEICNQNGVSLYLLRPDNLFVNHKTLEVKLVDLSGSARISHEGTLHNLSDINLILPTRIDSETNKMSFKEEHFMGDPYLAPEFFYSDITERTPYIDSWALGAMLFFLIFGEDPQSLWKNMISSQGLKYTKEPSEYYFYDIFPDKLVNEILEFDFGIKVPKSVSVIERSIKMKSFEGVFHLVSEHYNPNVDKSQEINTIYTLGSFLDVIQLLMAWKPHQRPTAKSLLYSSLFKSDKYQEMQMRQFSSLSFFYRSPSKCVRTDILLPLRVLCTTIINKPNKTLGLTNDILKLIDRVHACTNNQNTEVFQNLKDEFSNLKNPEENLSHSILDSITMKIKQTENKRLKLPNYSLIKFIFDNYILDLFLFAVLRHHTCVNEALAVDEVAAQDLEEHFYKPIKGFGAVLKRLIFDLNNYEDASAPYVGNVIDILVKFTVGEEFILASDIIDLIEKDSTIHIKTNNLEEYVDLIKQSSLL